ncbi:ribonuclease H [Streptomyces sp. NPDC051940]|uniref:ribonuclease H family protein n=1 Tax=Streptomyces sp. NPDC051940 TaxID=3155675 RepID=UPI00343505F2
MAEVIIAACDGASKSNPGPAAWAWVVAGADGGVERWEAGPLGRATNNVAELTALMRLLEATDPAVPLEVRMDSTYAMQAVTTWLPGWRRKGWKTAAGTPVANKELVVAIDRLLSGRDVQFVHVAAHQVDGDPYNAAADRAADEAARTQAAAGTSYGSSLPAADAARGAVPAARKSPPKTKTVASGRGGRTLAAKFRGTCRCGRSYARGDLIAKNSDGWGHPECVDGKAPTR